MSAHLLSALAIRQTGPGQNSPLSALRPIAAIPGKNSLVRLVPLATDAPQHDRRKQKDRQSGGPY